MLTFLKNNKHIRAVFINDADCFGTSLSRFISLALENDPGLFFVLEMRSTKVDKFVKPVERHKVEVFEHTVPPLANGDIDGIIGVLEEHKRLGVLRGLDHIERVAIFQKQAGRQLLVAMYQATSGRLHGQRAADELQDLDEQQKFVYGLICLASCYRYGLLLDEIILAGGDVGVDLLAIVRKMKDRGVIRTDNEGLYHARHRVISQLVYDELESGGQLQAIVTGILKVCAATVTKSSPRRKRQFRMLKTFLNHDFMKRSVGFNAARNIYSEFQTVLDWDAHYWLHRGALEIEANELDMAENFLGQAMGLAHEDLFIQTEWAVLLFKQALKTPNHNESPGKVQEATNVLQSIIAQGARLSAHAYHVLINEGVKWARVGIADTENKHKYLNHLMSEVDTALKLHHSDEHLNEVKRILTRELLAFAAD